jgi:hypothetical protein
LHCSQENFFGNRDTHAIGVQGGSRNLFEHNFINGSGGSGITFYQYGMPAAYFQPRQEMHDNVVRYNLVTNIWSAEVGDWALKGQHGIEAGGSHYAQGNLTYNNSVYYNIIVNVTHEALRSRFEGVHTPPEGTYQWKWLNNVIVGCGIGFTTSYECDEVPSSTPLPHALCYTPELVANNVFLHSRFAHQVGWEGSDKCVQ